jgi:glycosyltransferase involved in cell wall biosynthesis
MPMPITITHVVLSLEVGGLERVVLGLTREALAASQRVSVVCLEQRGALAERLEAGGTEVVCLGKPWGLHMWLITALQRAFCQLQTDLVHTHQLGPLFYAGPAARRLGIPVVHTEHGKHYGRRRTRWLGWVAGRSAQRFFCVSEDIAAAVRRHRIVPQRKIAVVPNGIDPAAVTDPPARQEVRQALGILPGAPVIGTVGRLDTVKRQDILLEAFARLKQHVPDAHLLLVGDGPERARLLSLAADMQLGDSAHFVGYQPQPGAYLQAMDVFALTSRSEGMPLSVLEAWAAGLPVVVSRVGGLPELVQDGATGLVCPFGDPDGVVAAFRRLLDDPTTAHRLGAAGRDLVHKRYTVQAMAQAYEREYRALLPAREKKAVCV